MKYANKLKEKYKNRFKFFQIKFSEIDDMLSKEDVINIVSNNDKIKKNLIGKKIIREIYVPGKIVNLVIS